MNVGEDAGQSEARVNAAALLGTDLYLRTDLDFVQNKGTCSYSIDEIHWTTLGGEFALAFDWRTGTFQGEQFAIFCYNQHPGGGFADVDWFKFTDTKSTR